MGFEPAAFANRASALTSKLCILHHAVLKFLFFVSLVWINTLKIKKIYDFIYSTLKYFKYLLNCLLSWLFHSIIYFEAVVSQWHKVVTQYCTCLTKVTSINNSFPKVSIEPALITFTIVDCTDSNYKM